MGESYVVKNDGSWIGSTGTSSHKEPIPDKYSEFDWYMLNRHKVNNLVSFDAPPPSREELYCAACNQKRRPFTKEHMLNMGLSEQFIKKVQENCEANKTY